MSAATIGSLGLSSRPGSYMIHTEKYSARFSFDDQIKPWLKVGGTLSYNNQAENIVDQSDQVNRSIVEDFPFLPVKYEDGTWADNRNYPNAEGRFNVVHRLIDTRYILNTQTTLGSLYSNINLAKGLEMRTILGSNIMSQQNNFSESRTLAINQRGIAGSNSRRETFWSLENYFTYNTRINDIHSFKVRTFMQHTDFYSTGARIETFQQIISL